MKKLIIASAVFAALAAAGPAAMAQGAECEAGSAYGPKPGCTGNSAPSVYIPNTDRDQSQGYGYYGYGALAQLAPYMLADGRWVVPPQANLPSRVYRPYPYQGRLGDIDGDGVRDRRDSDRDGDGTRNARDRYPDDYRYR